MSSVKNRRTTAKTNKGKMSEKELLRVGFEKVGVEYHIDVGSIKRTQKVIIVCPETGVKYLEKKGELPATMIELYNVKDRGELTAWMVNQIYFMFTGKELGLKGK